MLQGIIINCISNLYKVELENNTIYTCIPRGKLKQEGLIPVVGDYVEIEIDSEEKKTGSIEKVLERKNYIKRPKMANLTQIILVLSMKMPKPDLLLLDKQLAFLEFLKIKPVICLNKIDLVKQEEIEEIEKIYSNIGYDVIKTEAKTGKIEFIKEKLKGNITAFAGNSGVGKSTLINSIFASNITEEGLISIKNKKGKNTTTNITLYKIDKDTYVADTPGFSTFEINEIESNNLDRYFKEFNNYLTKCEYIGCNHIKEEKCGIKEAVEDEKINLNRYNNYCKIYNQIKEKEDHRW